MGLRGMLVVVLGVVGIGLGGCQYMGTGEKAPFDLVVVPGGASSGGGDPFAKSRAIDVSSGSGFEAGYELLTAYVVEPRVSPAAVRDLENFDPASFGQETRRAVEEALAGCGRFAVLKDRERARVVIEPRVSSVIPWQDTIRGKRQGSASDGEGGFFETSGEENIDRDGIDLTLSVVYRRSDGASLASGSALGRLTSQRGKIIRAARGQNNDAEMDTGSITQLDHAELDELRLVEVLNDTARGAVYLSLEQLDARLWLADRDESGTRRVRLAALE